MKKRKAPTTEYRSYIHAKGRCECVTNNRYNYYGGRGITFRFNSFKEFLQEVGLKPTPKHSLERINNDGHYESGNVKWATASEQIKNRRRTKAIESFTDTELIAEVKRRNL